MTKSPNSKSFQRFASKCSETRKHIATVRASLAFAGREAQRSQVPKLGIAEVLDISPKQHPHLGTTTGGFTASCKRAEINTFEFAFHRIYSHFGEYCRDILSEAFETSPMLVVGKSDGTIKFHELVKLGSYEAIGERMVESVFRKIESERNTKKSLEKLVSGMNVEFPKKLLNDTLGYLEARHIIVHRGGKIDQAFFDQHAKLFPGTATVDSTINLNSGVTFKAVDTVEQFVNSVDVQIVDAGIAFPQGM